MLEWKKSVNKCVGTQRITHILDYCIPSSNEYSAPIDNFYTALNDILRYCANPDVLENNLFLGPLMFTGIMSATENYIREILVSVLKICPISRAKASNQSICFGSVIWQGKDEIEKGAFENVSFADSSTIKKTLFNYLNINIKQSDLVFVQIEEFESICQIRHAV